MQAPAKTQNLKQEQAPKGCGPQGVQKVFLFGSFSLFIKKKNTPRGTPQRWPPEQAPAAIYIMRRVSGAGGAGSVGKLNAPPEPLLPLTVSYDGCLSRVLWRRLGPRVCPWLFSAQTNTKEVLE